MLGKLVHLGIDALLISAFLAGIKRSTGLTYVLLPVIIVPLGTRAHRPASATSSPALSLVPNKDVRRKYTLAHQLGRWP